MIPPVKQEPAATAVAIAPTPMQTAAHGENQKADADADAALEIALQPPETWYKDQFGRKATFELRVRRRSRLSCAQCAAQRLLSVQLLYESGKVVEKQEILHVMAGQCLNQNGESALAVRIAEVSKNHLNQRFRVEIAVPRCPGSCGYKTSVVSDPVLVLSKKKKRPVKQNEDTESPAKAKKPKRAAVQGTPNRKLSSDESPDSSSQSSSSVTGNVTAAIAEMEGLIPPQNSASLAPFTPDTPNLCLWANAAFDLLYKLQWQRVPTSSGNKPGANLDEILAQALSKGYKCPSCQETYGQVPAHRDDCDLKLLLDQGGQTDPQSTGRGNDCQGHHSPHWSAEKQFEWPDRPKAMYSGGDITPKIQTSPYNLSQDLLRLSGRPGGDTQVPANGFDAASMNINSWKDYASISKLLYSTSYLGGKSPQAGVALSPTIQWTGVLPPVGTLTPGFPTLPSAAKITQAEGQHGVSSERFSVLLAATKGMPTDAADLFRESEAALQGDGNIVNSLSNLCVSDLMRPNTGDNVGIETRAGHRPISLSALLSGDPPPIDMSLEGGVQVVLASDFQGCGFPALDASLALLGFYHLLTETNDSPAELRFTPNMFPLPDEMLRELNNTISELMLKPNICCRRELVQGEAAESLARLKSVVLHQAVR